MEVLKIVSDLMGWFIISWFYSVIDDMPDKFPKPFFMLLWLFSFIAFGFFSCWFLLNGIMF
jgi:hypothetical protein